MKEGDRRIKFQNVESGKKSERQNLIIIKKWPKFTLLKASFEKSERQNLDFQNTSFKFSHF
jgi:hypothetical protein